MTKGVPGVAKFGRRLWKSENGGIVVWAAFAVPAVSLLAIGATELAVLQTDKSQMQDVADAAALLGANQLTAIAPDDAIQQVKAYATAELAELAKRSTVTVDATALQEGGAVKVRLTSHRSSFFGNMLPPGGFLVGAEATAMKMAAGSSLCVLALDTNTGAHISLKNKSKINAPGCRVHSNSNITVTNTARIDAESIQAVGTATGTINPAAQTGALKVADPFGVRSISIPACDSWKGLVEYTSGVTEVEPGVHCGDFVVGADAVLKLKPGKHYFTGLPSEAGKLSIKNQGKLVGEDVVLYFSAYSKFEVRDQADIDLLGRKAGDDAGMLMIAARDNAKQWKLSSKAIRRLEGVIYLPAAELNVGGGNVFQVAGESKWTIAVVKRLTITDALSFVLNSNYAASSVPLPGGTAGEGGTRLVN